MLLTRQDLRYYIECDARANSIKHRIDYYLKLFYGNVNACVFRYLVSLRKYEYYYNTHNPLRLWWRYRHRQLGLKYNLAIPINVVGPGLNIPHIEGGVIINCKSVGANCTINSGVVVGNKNHDNSQLAVIGNNVEICVGAKIIGAVVVGENAVVAPNAVVVRDVSDNAIVGGVPAKQIGINQVTM